MELEAFFDAFKTIVDYMNDHISRLIRSNQDDISKTIDMLLGAKKNGRYVHIAGAGRSKIAGTIIGELLKNVGLKVSVIGETLSKPVRRGDVVIAISSSGWTNTTLFAVEQSIRLGAKIIGFTASIGSKLYRLADNIILLPGRSKPEELPYLVRQLMGKHKTPLTPMGTVSEFGALVIGLGLVNAIYHITQDKGDDPINLFKEPILRVLNEAEIIFNKLRESPIDVEKFLNMVIRARSEKGPKLFISGLGLCERVSEMIAMRYQHLGLNVAPIEEWRFRKNGDLLILISGSGENPIVLQYASEAKRSSMNLIGITANKTSQLSKLSDLSIIFSDISIREDYVKLRIGEEKPIFIPLFELISLLFLESTVAQIAEVEQISEEAMRSLHANVE